MTAQDVIVEPMTQRFCSGGACTVDRYHEAALIIGRTPTPALGMLSQTESSPAGEADAHLWRCAIVARVEDQVVGLLRFYPRPCGNERRGENFACNRIFRPARRKILRRPNCHRSQRSLTRPSWCIA